MSLFIVFGILLTAFAVGCVVIPLLRRSESGNAPVTATVMAVVLPAAVMLLYVSVSKFDWNASTNPAANTEAKLDLAETEILMGRADLAGETGQRIEEVLVVDPDNPRALFYGGMAAMARNDTELVKVRWERLLQMSPPPNVRQIIEEHLAALGSAIPSAGDAGDAGRGIRVRISVADELVSRIKPGAMLFLVAREPGIPGPPVAVIRKSAGDLPMQVRLSDADSMLPGRTLSALDRVQLIARIANGGDPTAQPGDISGQRVLSTEVARNETVSIHMDQIIE